MYIHCLFVVLSLLCPSLPHLREKNYILTPMQAVKCPGVRRRCYHIPTIPRYLNLITPRKPSRSREICGGTFRLEIAFEVTKKHGLDDDVGAAVCTELSRAEESKLATTINYLERPVTCTCTLNMLCYQNFLKDDCCKIHRSCG